MMNYSNQRMTDSIRLKSQWQFHVITMLMSWVISTPVLATDAPASLRGQTLLEMVEYSSKLAEPDLTPAITIYIDGTIEFYTPRYMRDAGLYRGQLDENQLTQVRELMSRIASFDASDAEEKYIDADVQLARDTGSEYYQSEQVITRYTLYTASSAPRIVVAEDVQMKAGRFSNLFDWQQMALAERQLKAMSGSVQLERVADAKQAD